jgi:VIT1/CCC1 family predicted Fe2+/Mn2+ transporter
MSKTTKAILFVFALVACLILAIFGWQWTDLANKPFWWNFWVVAAIAGGVGFLGLIMWYVTTKQDN